MMTPEEMTRMSRLRGENTQVHNENSALRGENNALSNEIDKLNSIITSQKDLLLDQAQLLFETGRTRQKLRRCKAENRILKFRAAGTATLDPLEDPLLALPLELQDMIRNLILRMATPVKWNYLMAFTDRSDMTTDYAWLPLPSRIKHLPVFLRCNTFDQVCICRVDPIIENYTIMTKVPLLPELAFRSVELTVDLVELQNPTVKGFPKLTETLPMLSKLANLQRFVFVIAFRSYEVDLLQIDAQSTLNKSGCLDTFRKLVALKTFRLKAVFLSEEHHTRATRAKKRVWFKETTAIIREVLRDCRSQCVFTADNFDTPRPAQTIPATPND